MALFFPFIQDGQYGFDVTFVHECHVRVTVAFLQDELLKVFRGSIDMLLENVCRDILLSVVDLDYVSKATLSDTCSIFIDANGLAKMVQFESREVLGPINI